MSLIGIRSFSKIETPPQNRLPIQTYVMRRIDKIIKDVIERELGRLGQVFVLHNNISTIEELRRKIKNLIPFSKIGVVHGQMNRDDIEEVMISFYSRAINVLISTTIIENGIDVPNANTIIIDRANTFGLAQLYQIRGRVGRSDRLGYAYLLIDEEKVLTEEAQKRLDTLKEFTELGSGYDISMRDLAIRGAGDLLGQEQAGFIETVGMDLYLKLLEEALAEKKGETVQKEDITSKNIAITAYLPDKFQQIEGEKFSFYQKIDETKSLEDVYNFESIILDTYGHIPSEVQNIIDKRKVNILLSSLGVDELKDNGISIIVTFPRSFSQINRFYSNLIEISRRIFDSNVVSVKNVSIILQIPKKNSFLTKLISLLIELKGIV
jgi:transcription-repair coupling factor (superfamily II helicase)